MGTRTTLASLLLGLTALGLAACGGDGEGPTDVITLTAEDIPGSYTATHWAVVRSPTDTVDILGQGGSITVVLLEDGTADGGMLVPPGALATELRNLGVDGTWSWRDDTRQVVLSLEAESFLQDMALDVRVESTGILLFGERPAPDGVGRVQVVLKGS